VIPAKSGDRRRKPVECLGGSPTLQGAGRDSDLVPAKLVPDFDQGAGNKTPNEVIEVFWIPQLEATSSRMTDLAERNLGTSVSHLIEFLLGRYKG
jgi:hypothetical protein